mmetsp:Transcript_9453/g.21337  ORF Transcript_9453/g.21337 Transcript_9453/m.21337 type:complete len:246 (-) Transcript_9453:72-809(-)
MRWDTGICSLTKAKLRQGASLFHGKVAARPTNLHQCLLNQRGPSFGRGAGVLSLNVNDAVHHHILAGTNVIQDHSEGQSFQSQSFQRVRDASLEVDLILKAENRVAWIITLGTGSSATLVVDACGDHIVRRRGAGLGLGNQLLRLLHGELLEASVVFGLVPTCLTVFIFEDARFVELILALVESNGPCTVVFEGNFSDTFSGTRGGRERQRVATQLLGRLDHSCGGLGRVTRIIIQGERSGSFLE